MSQILAHSSTTKTADTAYATEGSWDRTPPAGFGVTCKGLNTKDNDPNTVGMIFEVKMPTGYALNTAQGQTGSQQDSTLGTGFQKMRFVALSFGGNGITQLWEIWFNETDVDGDDWSLPVLLQVPSGGGSGTTYTYRFRKGGSGGGDGR